LLPAAILLTATDFLGEGFVLPAIDLYGGVERALAAEYESIPSVTMVTSARHFGGYEEACLAREVRP
jgi:hypothetical protein